MPDKFLKKSFCYRSRYYYYFFKIFFWSIFTLKRRFLIFTFLELVKMDHTIFVFMSQWASRKFFSVALKSTSTFNAIQAIPLAWYSDYMYAIFLSKKKIIFFFYREKSHTCRHYTMSTYGFVLQHSICGERFQILGV